MLSKTNHRMFFKRLPPRILALLFLILPATAVWVCPVAADTTFITPVDLDTVGSLGVPVRSPLDSQFLLGGVPYGDLTGTVYFDATEAVYTYTFAVTPANTGSLEFNTGGAIDGFNRVAGYSFAEAEGAGAPSGLGADAFVIAYEDDGTIDWNVRLFMDPFGFWAWDAITFFFQSALAPGTSAGLFTLTNCTTNGSARNYAPVPEPVTLVLVGCGLMGLAVLGRWRVRRS